MRHFSNAFFADADFPYSDAAYVLFGVPYDATTSYRPGTRWGPRAIRDISYNFEHYLPEYNIDLAEVPACDLGDLEPVSLPDRMLDQVFRTVREIADDRKMPVMLGGEHSVTIGAVEALKPDCYVVCDAHLDLRDEFGGTPLNHACVTRRVADAGVEDLVILGARSGTKEEFEFAQSLHCYTADEIRRRGIAPILEEVKQIIANRRVYLSIDADVIDCCLTPGLGTPEPFGLTPLDIREVIRSLAHAVIGFDYVEVCPVDDGQTAAVAARLIRDFIALHHAAHQQ